MAYYIAGCWMFGLAWTGVMSTLAPAESGWVKALARVFYVGGVAVILVVTAVIVAAGNSYAVLSPTRNGLWVYSLGAAVPVTLLGFALVRRALTRPVATALATAPALAFVVAAPTAFRPFQTRLTGLPLFAHRHHGLVVAAIAATVALLLTVVAVDSAPWPRSKSGATAPS